MDANDLYILGELQANARMSNADIARELKMAPSAILERIRKLEQKGLVVGYEARLAPEALGLELIAFVFVKADERPFTGKIGKALAAIAEVQEVHNVAGEDCYLLKIRARGTADLARILREDLSAIKGITSTRTTIVLDTVKETAKISLNHLQETKKPKESGSASA